MSTKIQQHFGAFVSVEREVLGAEVVTKFMYNIECVVFACISAAYQRRLSSAYTAIRVLGDVKNPHLKVSLTA